MSSAAARDLGRPRSRPGLALTLCTLTALALLLALGTWQVQRLRWKTDLIATAETRFAGPPMILAAVLADPHGSDYRPVQATGRYRNDLSFAMDAIGEDGELGARLVTPLDTGSTGLVLVERGWLPERLLPPATPGDLQPTAELTLTGHVRDRSMERAGLFTPTNQPSRRRWFWYDLPEIEQAIGHPVAPVVLTLDGPDTARDLPRPLPLRIDFPNNHLGYAITWYGLAAGLVAVYIAFGFRRAGD